MRKLNRQPFVNAYHVLASDDQAKPSISYRSRTWRHVEVQHSVLYTYIHVAYDEYALKVAADRFRRSSCFRRPWEHHLCTTTRRRIHPRQINVSKKATHNYNCVAPSLHLSYLHDAFVVFSL